jgi:hypothetical protein
MSGDKPPLPYIPSWRVQRQLGLLLVASMWSDRCHFITVFYFKTFYDDSCNREFLALRGKDKAGYILKPNLLKLRF